MIYVHTLGTASIDVGSCTITPTSPRKFAFLFHLASEKGRWIPRSVLQELVFPDQPDRNARHSLRELFYQVRQLGVELETGPDGIRLDDRHVHADYDAMIAREALSPDSVKAATGGFLPGFVPGHSEAYTEWYEGYRARSISALSRALVKEINRAKHVGEWDATEMAARACLALDPLHEAATLALAEMLALLGAKAKAANLLDEYMEGVGRIRPDLRVPAKALRRRLDQAIDSGPSRYVPRFIGRSEEMRRLRNLLQQSCAGESHFALVSGEPGIGKSRLISEFRCIIELEGYACQGVAMHPQDVNRPMGAFVDLVPSLLRLPGALGCSPESMESLQRLVGKASHSQPSEGQIDLDLIASGVTNAIGDLCEAIAAEQPLVVVIEDGHCLDQFSVGAISSLLSSQRTTRVLVVASTREPRRFLRALRHTERVHHVPLPPLSTRSTATLIADLLASSRLSNAEAPRTLVEASNGNPLFAVSLASHYRETGDSSGAPATLIESIERRIDPLSRGALSVLATCIALGKHCTTDRLIRALEMSALSLIETVSELSDLGLLDSRSECVAPLHPLIREVMEKRLLPATRSLVNHRVAELFEHDARARLSPALWWESAVRWREAGNAERAIAAIRQCANHAMQIGRATDAARMLSEVLELPTTQTANLAAARELVIAADLAVEPDLVLCGHQILSRGGAVAEHDEIELAERRAIFRKTQSPENLFEATRACLRSNASAEHRLAAATLALKCADIAGSGLAMAEMIEQETLKTDFNEATRAAVLEFELLVSSIREEWRSAMETAQKLLTQVEKCPAATRTIHQLNAGLAFFLGGQIESGLAAWRLAFDSASECKSPSMQLRAAVFLATINLDLCNDAEYEFWLRQGIAATLQAPELANHFDLLVVQLEGALSHGDFSAAEAHLERARLSEAFCGSMTRVRWGRAFNLMLRALRAVSTPVDEQLARAILEDRVPSISGFRDLEIAAAAEVLSVNDADEARALIRDYLTGERSGRRLINRELARVSRRLFSATELDAIVQPTRDT